MFIYRLAGYMSSISTTVTIIAFGYWLFYLFKSLFKGEKLSFAKLVSKVKCGIYDFTGKHAIILLIVALFSVFITDTTFHQLIGIHNLRIKPEGTYCFYVDVTFAGGESSVLPASVRIEKDEEDVGDKVKVNTNYYVESIALSDGTLLDVDDQFADDINEVSDVYVTDSHIVELSLLNKHAFSPYVQETNNATPFAITYLLLKIVSILFFFIICVSTSDENE